MANYPTFPQDKDRRYYITTPSNTLMWNISAMPKKLYMHTDGVLVAIRPLFFAMMNNECSYAGVFGFEKAGFGQCTRIVNTKSRNDFLFLSPDDFEKYKKEGVGQYKIPLISLEEVIRVNGYSTSKLGYVELWRIVKGSPESSTCCCHIRVWSDRDGAHADHLNDSTTGGLYKSREECAAAIPKAKVVDFDDEPEPAVEQEYIVNLPKQVAVTAKTAEEAEAKVAESIRNLVSQ